MGNISKNLGIIVILVGWFLLAPAFWVGIGIFAVGIILYILGMIKEEKMLGPIFVAVGFLLLPSGLFFLLGAYISYRYQTRMQLLGWAYPIILISICIIITGIILFVLKRKKVKHQQEQEVINAGKNE